MQLKDTTLPSCMMPDGAEPCQGYSQLLEICTEQAEEITNLKAEISNPWISADDRLPDDNVTCLILLDDRSYRITHMKTHECYKHWMQNTRNEWVKYWMPIRYCDPTIHDKGNGYEANQNCMSCNGMSWLAPSVCDDCNPKGIFDEPRKFTQVGTERHYSDDQTR